jgi:hypothetical protein
MRAIRAIAVVMNYSSELSCSSIAQIRYLRNNAHSRGTSQPAPHFKTGMLQLELLRISI